MQCVPNVLEGVMLRLTPTLYLPTYQLLPTYWIGFGFVGFDSEEVVDKLCQTHFHQINGKTVC